MGFPARRPAFVGGWLIAGLLAGGTVLATPPGLRTVDPSKSLRAGGLSADQGGVDVHAWKTPDYPIQIVISYPAALLHWLDSLAALGGPGFTGGRTSPSHRQQYTARYGNLGGIARSHLNAYKHAREQDVRGSEEAPFELTQVFLAAPTVDWAVRRAAGRLEPRDRAGFIEAIHYFDEAYRPIWDEARRARAFVARTPDAHRLQVAAVMADVARFLDVPPDEQGPRIYLMPVPSGRGTHAQTIGDAVLMEIRHDEVLADQAGTLIHESAHVLFRRIDAKRQAAFEATVRSFGSEGARRWGLLLESLPTALGEGVGMSRLRPRIWSRERRWYFREDVDDHAKRIHDTVALALRNGATFDDAMLRRLLRITPAEPNEAP